MTTQRGSADGRRDWSRCLGELSRVVVITTSVLGTVAAIVLLVLVMLTFLGLA